MPLNYNIILICVTCVLITQIIMKGLFDIAMAKNAGNVMKDNFNSIVEKINVNEKGKK